MKKVEFESAQSLHKKWEDYSNKHDSNKDVEALYKLVEGNSSIARNETEVLASVYDSAVVVLDSTPQLDNEQKTRASYFMYNLCTCDSCKKECGAHINKKGQIRISQKFFIDTLNKNTSLAIGVMELMYTILHEFLHGIFPELDEEKVTEKTEKVWKSGMTELVKQKSEPFL